jgi:hypothetical protein
LAFDRVAQIEIGKKNSLIALRVEGLRITFEVTKDLKTSANQAKISIYNLKPETRAQIKELTDVVTLRAGYADETISEVFQGDIVSISHPKEGPDIITKIEANDGGAAIRGSFANLSYIEGTSLKKVLADIIKSMGLPVKFLDSFDDQQFLQGFSFAGKARTALDKVVARAGMEWSIQSGQLKILKRGGTDNPKNISIPLVSPGSGLIGSPERIQQLKDEATPEKKPPGWKVTTVLLPAVEPGNKIGFTCAQEPQAKAYRVQNVKHNGDTHGADWKTVSEVIEPGEILNVSSFELAPGERIA